MAAARIAEEGGDSRRALAAARAAVANQADDPAPRELLCRLLFRYGLPDEMTAELVELIKRDPNNAAAHHNLGIGRLIAGDVTGAAEALQDALRLRPDYRATQEALDRALQTYEAAP